MPVDESCVDITLVPLIDISVKCILSPFQVNFIIILHPN